MINVAFNMETADPDDVFTLCLLSDHPKVNLVGVVITPGSDDQVSLVKHVLNLLGKNIPVGMRKLRHPKLCVSEFHYKWFGKNINKAEGEGPGADVLGALYKQYPDLKILSGAPLGNICDFLLKYSIQPDYVPNSLSIDEMVIQGGFAGDSVVPKEYRLEKFKGRETCPTFNLGGDRVAALFITEDKDNFIKKKFFVSKNVCHSISYDQIMHEKLRPYKDARVGLNMIYEGMSLYLQNKPTGKLFHDPFAACALIDKAVCEWAPVTLFYFKGEWGSVQAEGSNTMISIKANMDKFEQVLLEV